MKKRTLNNLIGIGGILLLAAGLLLLKLGTEMAVLPYICIGLGCGLFGHGAGDWVNDRVMKDYPDIQKKIAIEQNDERNVAIANRAKAKAYDGMLYLFGAVMIAFALMGVEWEAILLLVAAYLFVIGSFVYYLNKYHKEM